MKNAITENWQIAESRSKYVRVVYNSLLDAPKQSVQLQSKSSDITVMTLGHVDVRKNPSIWFEAAKTLTIKYPSVRFEWLGNGPLLTHFQSLASDFDNIHFCGHSVIAQQQLKTATIYYQPSIIEPQGIAVLEAMNNKLPCVVSNVGGLPESVINGYNGHVVSATDVDEHVRAISSLIEDKDLRKQFGENSYARYNELFTYASFKSKMDAIYQCA
ncbi:glycosyltransferase family 4 protein [Mucilaginibacter pallidiroseus]|nr:glycosyltransferase family 4 protein [Mucilaginibacter pallidiroseus]